MTAETPIVAEIVGRRRELNAVERLLDLASQQARALVIEGEAGIGKTRVWKEGLERARGRGVRTMVSRPGGADVQLAFAGLADLLRNFVDEGVDQLPPPQREALSVALLLEAAGRAPPNELAVAGACLRILQSLATATPLLVAVDDVQWLDAPSARVLEFVLRRLDAEPVGVMLTLRSESDQPAPQDLLRAIDEERLEKIRLGPLSAGALHELIRSRLGLKPARPLLLRLHETSGGNPFYALQLAQALAEADAEPSPGEPLPVPASLRELVSVRLGALSEPARETLLAAAVLTRASLPLVAEVVGDRGRAAQDVDEAAAAGVIEVIGDEIRFAHPLLASTHYATAPPLRRRMLHARLAEVVTDHEERARHLALAAEGPEARVADELEAAATVARGRGAIRAVAELLEQAVLLTPDKDREDRFRRRLAAAEAQLASGNAERARALLDDGLPEARPGRERAEILYRLGTVMLAEDVGRSVELLRAAEQEAGTDDALRAKVLCALAGFAYGLWIGYDEKEECARNAAGLAERAGDRRTLSLALALQARSVFLRGGGLDEALLQRAVSIEEELGDAVVVGEDASASVICAETLIEAERLDPGRLLLERLCDRARRAGDAGVAYPLFLLAMLEFDAGRWSRAEAAAQEAVEIAVQGGRETTEVLATAALGTVEGALGRVSSARRILEGALGLAERTGRGGRAPRYGLGLLELSLGDWEVGWRWLEPAIERILPLGLTEPAAQVSDGVEALAELGRPDDASRLLSAFEQPARRLGRRWALAAEGDLVAAESALREAIEIGDRLSRPLELGRSLLALGTVQRRLQQKQAARATLGRALEVFEQLGATLWAERAKRESGRIGGRVPYDRELSATEERIAALTCAGRTNKEIALALHLSVKTVEWNLSKIYRKLGVRSRTELAAAYHDER